MTFIFEEVTRPEVIRREKRVKQFIIGLLIALVVGGFLYYEFKNYPEERVVKKFLTTLRNGDYQSAYRIWQPSSTYSFQDFQRDWGPGSEYGKVDKFSIESSHDVGSGVLIVTKVNGHEAKLQVEKKDKSMAFAPF